MIDTAKLREIAGASREARGYDQEAVAYSNFHTTFDPPTVLALIDELETMRGYELNRDKEIVQTREQRDSARALLREIKQWAAKRCPCDNDDPKICPLCDADVTKDRCMAVDASFPKAIRASLDTELGGSDMNDDTGEKRAAEIKARGK